MPWRNWRTILNIITGVSDIAISGEDNEMTNLKHPTSNIQAPDKLHIPSSKLQTLSKRKAPMQSSREIGVWKLSGWNFSGAWGLESGALARSCRVLTLALALLPISS